MDKQPFYAELVSLEEASAAAHHALTTAGNKRLSPDRLAERRREIALAVAALVPVYSDQRERFSFHEVEKLIAQGKSHALYIQRVDLVRCVEMLLATDDDGQQAPPRGRPRGTDDERPR